MITIDLEKIRQHIAVLSHYGNLYGADTWKKILEDLKQIKAIDTTALPFESVLESSGLDNAFLCLFLLSEDYNKVQSIFACNLAESVLPIFEKEFPHDSRPRYLVAAVRTWAKNPTEENRDALIAASNTIEEEPRIWQAGWDTARCAVRRAADCALQCGDVRDVAEYATLAVTQDAAKTAAEVTGWDHANEASWYLAGKQAADAERKRQEAEFREFCHLRGEYGEFVSSKERSSSFFGFLELR